MTFAKKKSSVISLKTSYRYFRQLLSNFATFFCPTNKDSIQKERFKPIGFLIRVKKVQDEKHTGARYLISNFERYFFWTLVWPKSKVKVFFFIECKKKSFEWCSHMTFGTKKILLSYRWEHHKDSVDNFWTISDDYLER